ncbi:MAG: HAD family hydrolase [Candidatus Tectomicrobia bacterium]|nr:HAD family hydrolase [Candidatus Tectomicrobia bacterium]
MRKYDAIFFDMGETLVYHRPSHEEVFYTVLEQLGWRVSPQQRAAGMRWARQAMSSFDARLRDAGVSPKALEEEFFRAFLEAVGIAPITPELIEQVQEKQRALRQEQKMVCPPGVHELLRELRGTGYHLGIISNWDASLSRHCDEHGLSPYFDGIHASMLVGSSKPDAGIFQHALAQAGVAPQRALHVGDNYYADVLGARAAGMQPLLLDPHRLHPDADCPSMPSLTDLPAYL